MTKKADKKNGNGHTESAPPRCLAVAQEGIQTSPQLARYLSSLMSDVIEGTISPIVANAGVNAAGKLLKTVEMQQKYGTPQGKGSRILRLCGAEEAAPVLADDTKTAEIAALEARLADLRAG